MRLVFTLIFLFMFSGLINAKQPSLDVVMKEMALSFKHAKTAKTSDEFKSHLEQIENALIQSKKIGFSKEAGKSLEGIDRVLSVVNQIKDNAHDLKKAKSQLRDIDKLRKQYHKIHEPSVWDVLFGG